MNSVNPDKHICYGCFACFNVCKHNAIIMELDKYGFYKPKITIQCKSCKQCVNVCPALNSSLIGRNYQIFELYGAWSMDFNLRTKSSSGGIFGEIAKYVLEKHGKVCGCVWGDNLMPKHILCNNTECLDQIYGSKYIPSNLGYIYNEILNCLVSSDDIILFSGTPCQIAAINLFIDEKYKKRLITCEVICHGIPSLKVFHSYLNTLFGGDNVATYSFRSKKHGWVSIKATSITGKEYHSNANNDLFMTGFAGNHLFLNEGCYRCPFQKTHRIADITLGDYWACPKNIYSKEGVSLISINSIKGKKIIDQLNKEHKIQLYSADKYKAATKTPRLIMGWWHKPKNRILFLNDVANGKSFEYLVSRYYPNSVKYLINRLINKIIRIYMIKKIQLQNVWKK